MVTEGVTANKRRKQAADSCHGCTRIHTGSLRAADAHRDMGPGQRALKHDALARAVIVAFASPTFVDRS